MGVNTNSLYNDIDRGREGKNIGISTGIPALDSKIYGIQKKSIMVIGGLSGSAKTTFALHLLYNAFKERETFDFFKIVMYSLEMSPNALLAKLLSLHIFNETGEKVTYAQILSLTGPIDKKAYDLIQYYRPWMEDLENYMVIYNDTLTNKSYQEHQQGIYEQWGTFDKVGDQWFYRPNTENYMIISIIDHVSLVTHTGPSPKPEIDAIVKSSINLRDVCQGTYIFVQQLNRASQSVERLKTEGSAEINLSDFRDTSDTCNAAEVVIGLFNPYREKLRTHRGYEVCSMAGLKSRYRSIILAEILNN